MNCLDTENGSIRDLSFKIMKKFIINVLKNALRFEKSVILRHNGSSFDMILAARSLFVNQGFDKEVRIIAKGQNIMEMAQDGRKSIFWDTYLYMSVKLAKFPKTLGLKNSMKKREFPYLLNVPENQEYNDHHPHFEYYDPECRTEEEYKVLKEWHDECVKQKYKFNIQLE